MHQVVIIDDDPINNFIYTKIVQDFSETIEIKAFDLAETGSSYLENNYQNISLVILDINMPFVDGWMILDLLERKDIKLNIIILTSSISDEDFERSRKYKNIVGYVTKPTSLEELSEFLLKYLK
ncbi:MAG: response regulator [Bacteroidota bacterium]|nr:response regulator [Bacteroidota bacterium]